jgi:hypothetical protein
MTVVIQQNLQASPPSPTSCNPPSLDPPPPYPSRERRARAARSNRRHRLQTAEYAQLTSTDSHSDHEASSPQLLFTPVPFLDEHDRGEPTETTPFLAPSSPISTSRRLAGRPRAYSHTSTVSIAPSLGQTVLSLFVTDDGESDYDEELERGPLLLEDGHYDRVSDISRRHRGGSFAAMKRYFRPLVQKAYYRSLFHLLVVNFPYALAAWIYLFVFTVV